VALTIRRDRRSRCRPFWHLVRGRPRWRRRRLAASSGPGSEWVYGTSAGAQADSAFDSSRPWIDSYRGGQQRIVAHGIEYGHGPPKTPTDDCPADGIQKVRGSNPLGSTTTCGGHRSTCVRPLVLSRSMALQLDSSSDSNPALNTDRSVVSCLVV